MTDSLPDKFASLTAALNEEHIERTDDIQAALWALVSGTTLFLLGEPGIAKSMMARRIAARIEGSRFFDIDLDRLSTKEELFDPFSLGALRESRWEREIDGTLVTADWAFIDEFFEAPSTLLKTMLRALNERTYRNGNEILQMPLTTVIAASNDVPTEARLMPLYDRLVIRRKLSRVSDGGGFLRMLALDLDPKPAPLLSWDEVLQAQSEARTVGLPDPVMVAMMEIRKRLAREDIRPSDRRFVEAMKVVRAAAWLDGSTTAEPEHLLCLTDICWTHPDQIPTVSAVVNEVVEPLTSEADSLLRAVVAIEREINPELAELDRRRLAMELQRKCRRAGEERDRLRAQVNPRNARQVAKLDKLNRSIKRVSDRILREMFQIDPLTGDET